MKKILQVLAVAAMLLAGTVTSASAATPVVPNAPIVSAPYAGCINGTFTVIEQGSIDLPSVLNGRWLDSDNGVVPSKTLTNVPAGEYTFGFVTAEGDFSIPASPGGQSDYRLENGVAYYTVIMPAAVPYVCDKPVTPKKPVLTAPVWRCFGTTGTYVDQYGTVSSPAVAGGYWKKDGVKSAYYSFPAATNATLTYTFVPKAGYYTVGQTSYTVTITSPVKPLC